MYDSRLSQDTGNRNRSEIKSNSLILGYCLTGRKFTPFNHKVTGDRVVTQFVVEI